MKNHSQWFDLRSRSTGKLAFMVHRLSGIGLVVYLYLHLAVLNQLRQGPQAWDDFVEIVRSPLFLLLDAVLLFGILIHGLNGMRLVLVGLGIFLQWERVTFWFCLILATCLTILGIAAMY
jgi:succinate dehydrogenase cytochrome b subunit